MSRAKAQAERNADDLYVTPRGCVAPLLKELAPHIPDRPYVLDPGAGSGSISRAVLAQFPRAWVEAAELRETHTDDLQGLRGPPTKAENGRPYETQIYRIHWGDFLTTTPDWQWRRWNYSKREARGADLGGPDLVVGNPPYRRAEAFVRRSIEISDGLVAMLLRVAFLETQERYPFWCDHPPLALRVLVERPSFSHAEVPDAPKQPDLFGEVHDVGTPSGGTDLTAYAWLIWGGAGAKTTPPLAPFGWYRWRTKG